MQIAKHKLVSIDYRLTDEAGIEIDSSGDNGPLTYVHGMQEIIPGLEQALEGHVAGDSFEVTVLPVDAYGEQLEELFLVMPRAEFEEVDPLEQGMQFALSDEDDEEMVVTVVDFDDDTVTVDGNHPLAGVTLNFSVQVCEVRDATAEEIEQSQSHACGHDCDCDDDPADEA